MLLGTIEVTTLRERRPRLLSPRLHPLLLLRPLGKAYPRSLNASDCTLFAEGAAAKSTSAYAVDWITDTIARFSRILVNADLDRSRGF